MNVIRKCAMREATEPCGLSRKRPRARRQRLVAMISPNRGLQKRKRASALKDRSPKAWGIKHPGVRGPIGIGTALISLACSKAPRFGSPVSFYPLAALSTVAAGSAAVRPEHRIFFCRSLIFQRSPTRRALTRRCSLRSGEPDSPLAKGKPTTPAPQTCG